MPKIPPPHDADGYYHIVIPLHDGQHEALDSESNDFETTIRAISSSEAESLTRLFQEIGRNQSCPCGSGTKFTKCCLRKAN